MNAERVYDWQATVAVPEGTHLTYRNFGGVASGPAHYSEDHALEDVRAYLRRNGVRGAVNVYLTAR